SVAVLAQYLRASDPPPISKARPGVGSVASVGPCNSDAAASCFRTGILSSRCDQRHRPAVRLMASTLSALPFLTDKSNPIGYCVQGMREFAMDSRRLLQRCTKPDAKEFKKIAVACAMGFAIMGFIGYTVKLVFIPINNIIVGGS
ncbi:unnamed protein product, partial [Prorocentrum cordatum]